jgi:hypothetical protein
MLSTHFKSFLITNPHQPSPVYASLFYPRHYLCGSAVPLHVAGIYWLHERHFDLSSLCVLILLHFDAHRDLVEYGNLNIITLYPRGWYCERIVVSVEPRLSLDRDQTFDTKPAEYVHVHVITRLADEQRHPL